MDKPESAGVLVPIVKKEHSQSKPALAATHGGQSDDDDKSALESQAHSILPKVRTTAKLDVPVQAKESHKGSTLSRLTAPAPHCQRFMDRGNKPVPQNYEVRDATVGEGMMIPYDSAKVNEVVRVS